MSHIVESYPLTKLNGSLSKLHSADEEAVSWVTNYGSRHAYKKKTAFWTEYFQHNIMLSHCVLCGVCIIVLFSWRRENEGCEYV